MKQTSELGMNRTGIQTSPLATTAMKSTPVPEVVKQKEHDASLQGIVGLRKSYIEDADPIGTVPLPATMKGAVKAGAQAITGKDPTLFMDKLGERLAFERSGVRLYDVLIAKCKAQAPDVDLGQLMQFRAEEAKHFQIVREAIEKLGGDPTAQTPAADAVALSSMGLVQVLTDPRSTIEQCVQAVHTAELVDNDSWDLLIKLAKDAGQDDMVDSFQEAMEAELEHLDHVRRWHERLVLGKEVSSVQ